MRRKFKTRPPGRCFDGAQTSAGWRTSENILRSVATAGKRCSAFSTRGRPGAVNGERQGLRRGTEECAHDRDPARARGPRRRGGAGHTVHRRGRLSALRRLRPCRGRGVPGVPRDGAGHRGRRRWMTRRPGVVPRPVSRAAADALRAGRRPTMYGRRRSPGRVAVGIVRSVGSGAPLGPFFTHRAQDDAREGQVMRVQRWEPALR